MGAYLIDHKPVRDQFDVRTRWARSRPTGLTVVHTAESVMDTVGPDTGAEAVAEFIRTRTTPGSYHSLCDSDSRITLVPFDLAAYQDGTGSNGYALSISFACCTSDWRSMSPEKRHGFLRQGALAFVEQQAWLRANGYPTTPLRLVSKADSDRGVAGFIYHGHRDPARRSDPGVAAPNLFPWDEWLDHCRAALTGQPLAFAQPLASDPFILGDHDMRVLIDNKGSIHLDSGFEVQSTGDPGLAGLWQRKYGTPISCTEGEVGTLRADNEARRARLVAELAKASGVDTQSLAQTVVTGLLPQLTTALAGKTGATREDIEAAVREVFADAGS